MKKKISILMLFLFILTVIIPSSLVKAEESSVKIKADFGVQGVYKSYREMPINIEVESETKDIQGEIQVTYPLQDQRGVTISQEISLAKGDKKNIVLSIPVGESLNKIVVSIYNKGKKEYEEELKVGNSKRLSPNKLLVGTLTEDPNSLSYIESLNINIKNVKGLSSDTTLVNIPEGFLKENSKVLDVFDVIVIDNYDTSKLSKGQIDTLRKWVEGGRELVIGTGVYGKKTLGMFKDDYIKINSQELKKVGEYQVMPLTIETSKNILDESGYFQKIQKGNGNIIFSSYSLGSEPFNKLIGKDSIKNIIDDVIPAKLLEPNSSMSGMDYRIQNMVGNVLGLKLPNTKILLLILLLYALIIGPVGYFIFKKLKKSSLLWIGIPIAAVIFTVIISIVGGTTRLKNPIMNIKNFILVDDQGKGNVNSLVGVIFPYKSDLEIQEPESSKLETIMDSLNYNNRRSGDFTKNVVQKINYVDGKRIYENKDMSPFSPAYFSLSGGEKTIGKLNGNLNYNGGKIQGNLINNLQYDLNNSYLITSSGIYELGGITKGKSMNITDTMKKYRNINDFISNSVANSAPMTEAEMQEQTRKRIEFSDIEYFLNSYLGIFTGNSVLNKNYIIGYIDDNFAENLSINNRKVDKKEKTLVAFPVDLSYEHNGIVEYPFGLITPELDVKSQVNGVDLVNGEIYEAGELELEYTIEGMASMDKIYFIEDLANSRNGLKYSDIGKFEIYNYKTSKYDEYKLSSDKKEFSPEMYSSKNKVKIRVTADNTENGKMPTAIPQIAVTGRAK
ncbi:hypothetical protein [Clostridium sp. 'White wine YQ']|uniref:hypothetical protein n=1 Tax=Clostridium sp. 'White wine YQ' TaxID=3027474 RepID=UPI002365BF57|nr:hypothetical protein [Clostridium sp. 'White wine YQ']MDD7792884.1 hypothetical protein [Clostridium sp. 'White wine YQ']